MSVFTKEDLIFLQEKGISLETVQNQIQTFMDGISPVRLSGAAVVGDGILRFSPDEQRRLQQEYRKAKKGMQIVKFIPASGAASRMFKALFAFLNEFDPAADNLQEYLDRPENNGVKKFYEGLREFPFYELILSRLEMPQEHSVGGEFLYAFVKEMLTADGFNYGFYPKGLLPFHFYEGKLSTPFEEHLKEGAAYARGDQMTHLHFTISPQHRTLFEKEYNRVAHEVKVKTGCAFQVDFSYQKTATDTLAVTPENEPFRDKHGRLLFRPGGHGALIENLNEQDADVLFIKNIDNVVPERSLEEIAAWKEVLGGYLLEVQQQAYSYARMLAEGKVDNDLLNRICDFLRTDLNVRFPEAYTGYSLEEQITVLMDKLARPIRVCGMVRNEGEPGGGPFWISDSHGNKSLQIVESAQVDMDDEDQRKTFQEATHFNPVDLVCGVRDAFGEKFNLLNFVEQKLGFITEKTFEGRPLKALELPGLWNGGMAYWNTVFVEVPISTFNPVKTINDLLKPAHQAG
ncbi:MAG: DUF4301 family protein [Robiginitalea sp.]|jgi:hypothetical protein